MTNENPTAPKGQTRFRVLHVFKVYRPSHGGIVHVMEKLARGFAQAVESRVLVSRERGLGSIETVDEVPVRRTGSLGQILALPLSPTFLFWFWRYARNCDVVSYHYPFPLVDLAVSLWFPQRTALVVHWHSEIVAQARVARFLVPLFRRCLRRADRVIVASPAHVSGSALLSAVADKCVVVPFGVDVDTWSFLSPDESAEVCALRKRYPRLILAVGRLVPYKGFDILMRAMGDVDATLMLIGEGPLEEKLRSQAAEKCLEKRVLFRGAVGDSALKVALHAANVFVLPSVGDNEAFGIVQLEAMACAKPVVNTALGTAVPWVARNGQEGLTVQPRDPDALAAAINRLLNDPHEARRLGANGLVRARTCFSDDAFFARTLATYQQAARERQGVLCKL